MKKSYNKTISIILNIRDMNAKAMWSRTKSQVFKDKTKYTRKSKHKHKEED